MNLYAYVSADPINRSDPSGLRDPDDDRIAAQARGGYIPGDASGDARARAYIDANPPVEGRSSTIIGVGGGISARFGGNGSVGVVFNEDEARLFGSGGAEVSTSGTASASGGLMIGRMNGDPVDFGGIAETRSVTVGDGPGGTYTSFASSSATGAYSVEGEILTIGTAQGASAAYGSSQTTTVRVDDAASAVLDRVAAVVDDVYYDEE